jgi:hypothetical protein
VKSPLEELNLGGVEIMARHAWSELMDVITSKTLLKVTFYTSSQDGLGSEISAEYPELFEQGVASFGKYLSS